MEAQHVSLMWHVMEAYNVIVGMILAERVYHVTRPASFEQENMVIMSSKHFPLTVVQLCCPTLLIVRLFPRAFTIHLASFV